MSLPFNMWLYDVLLLSSILSIVGVSAMAYGYRASLFNPDRVVRLFAASLMLLAVGYTTRRFTWDVVMPFLFGIEFFSPLSIVFNVINIAAAYVGLKARWLMIPEEERKKWSWYSAWMYPGILRLRIRIVPDKES